MYVPSIPLIVDMLEDCCSNPQNHRYLYENLADCPAYDNGTNEEIEYEMNMVVCTVCGAEIE